ncbi:hypothetical protein BJX66DRAFT_229252 [Aspergillus keveii]|uniref:Uncharacterized protein n=1 Tax=Aspergillus keveii TaxID=714993 RepID=A0ABR4GLC6_9EURO
MDSPHVAQSDKHPQHHSARKYDPEAPEALERCHSSSSSAPTPLIYKAYSSSSFRATKTPIHSLPAYHCHCHRDTSPGPTIVISATTIQRKGATWPALATILSSSGANSALKSLSASVPSLQTRSLERARTLGDYHVLHMTGGFHHFPVMNTI